MPFLRQKKGQAECLEGGVKCVAYCPVHCKMAAISTWQGLSGGLIGQPGQALIPPQNRQHVEDAG